jgi:hypothetical protein
MALLLVFHELGSIETNQTKSGGIVYLDCIRHSPSRGAYELLISGETVSDGLVMPEASRNTSLKSP